MVEMIVLHSRRAWLKRYGNERRVLSLGALRIMSNWLSVAPLRPPPRHLARTAKLTEVRRLQQLRLQGVRVPEVMGEGKDSLVLSDLGPTLASRLRACDKDPAAQDRLTRDAVLAIADGHRRGAYFGQPWPRNMTVLDGAVGFLDFEEDPLEVMSLPQAQARDWLLFSYGVARFYAQRDAALASLLQAGVRSDSTNVLRHTRAASLRLHPLASISRVLGASAQRLATAVLALRSATSAAIVMGLLLLDWVTDGEMDATALLATLL